MWPPTITPCECTHAGWCERHRCWKLPAMHLLCRRQMKAYQEWEEGRGPCLQEPPASLVETSATEAERERQTDPSLAQRAMNLGRAIVRHVADKGQTVADDSYEMRLAVCRECELCDTARMVCRHQSCGCFLQIKARWQSEDCPLKKWPSIQCVPPEND